MCLSICLSIDLLACIQYMMDFSLGDIIAICERVWEKGPYGAKIEIEI